MLFGEEFRHNIIERSYFFFDLLRRLDPAIKSINVFFFYCICFLSTHIASPNSKQNRGSTCIC